MAAGTLNCPTCGASVANDETSCRYCGSRLATVACPACFGTMFVASRFCPHCGAAAAAADAAAAPEPAATIDCVNCRTPMRSVTLGATVLHECERCLAVWVDPESFHRICAEHERQADVLGAPRSAPAAAATAPPVKRPITARARSAGG